MPDHITDLPEVDSRAVDRAAEAVTTAREALDEALVQLGKEPNPDDVSPAEAAKRKYGDPKQAA